MYGCSYRSVKIEELRKNLIAKLLPVLMHVRNPIFHYPSCSFKVHRDKETTARVVMFREM